MNPSTDSSTPSWHRAIRSFVLREGRLTLAQERAFRELWPRFGLDWSPGVTLDCGAIFGNDRPVVLEIERRALTNLRIVRHDAVAVLARGIPPASLDAVQLFFPDPWPKRRHRKRRILSPELVDLLAQAIRPGGIFHAATDWEPYAEQMLDTLDAAADRFENAAGQGQFAPRPAFRPLTRFEQRGERLGHRVRDLLFRRR